MIKFKIIKINEAFRAFNKQCQVTHKQGVKSDWWSLANVL